MYAIKQFFAISKLTLLEAVRQPVCLLLCGTALLLIAGTPLMVTHTLGETQKAVMDSAMAVHFLTGLLLGTYASCASLVREIRRGTASAILSKPVGRTVFFLAKFAGVAGVLVTFSIGAALTAMLSARVVHSPHHTDWQIALSLISAFPLALLCAAAINYWLRRPFVSTAYLIMLAFIGIVFFSWGFVPGENAEGTGFGAGYRLDMIPVSVLITFAIVVLVAMAVSLATSMDAVPTLSLCGTVFLVGLMSDYLFGRFAGHSWIANVFYHLIPNWQHFWVTDALRNEVPVPWSYVGEAGLYATVYIAGILIMGLTLFRRMEMK